MKWEFKQLLGQLFSRRSFLRLGAPGSGKRGRFLVVALTAPAQAVLKQRARRVNSPAR